MGGAVIRPDAPLFIAARRIPDLYGIPWSTVRSWIYRKRADGRPLSPVPFSRVGRGAVVFNRVQLEAFIERQTIRPAPGLLRRAVR